MPDPAINMGEPSPLKPWLVANGLPLDADPQADPNADGVNLLMAYALALDPNRNLSGSLPRPVVSANQLSLSFHATTPGITYRAETSTDLQTWTTADVTQSAPGPDGRSTASVPLDAPRRFMRLVVSHAIGGEIPDDQ